MFMPQRSEFHVIEPVITMVQRMYLKEDLRDGEVRIAISNLAMAGRAVMADSDQSGWFCLRVEPRREHKVNHILVDNDIESWVPCSLPYEFVSRGRVKTIRDEPVIRGYVLVRCAKRQDAFLGLKTVKDVMEIVGGTYKPWCARDEDINLYRAMLVETEDEKVERLTFHEGDMVKVRVGPFDGFDGRIVQVAKKRAKVCASVFGHQTEINIPLAHLIKL